MEQKILSASIDSREAYETLEHFAIGEYLSDAGGIIWEEISKYYTQDQAIQTADTDILKDRLEKNYPKHFEALKTFVFKEAVSLPNLITQIEDLQSEVIRNKIALACRTDDPQLTTLFEEFHQIKQRSREKRTLRVDDLNELLTTSGKKIKVLPSILNRQLEGGVSRKHHIMVFGLGEIGKSLFILNMAYGFVKQGLKVGFLDNEDNPEDVLKRYVVRAAGTTLQDFKLGPEPHIEKALALKGEFIFKEITPGTPHEIRKWAKDNKPDVLIVNQIRNLRITGVQSPEQQRERASMFMRTLGKECNLVPVSVTQASATAQDKMYITQNDMDYSKVGCPAQSDLLIGIGGTVEYINGGQRMCSVIRNKISGIHLPFRTTFDTQRVKVE